jgi:hypothetical protein
LFTDRHGEPRAAAAPEKAHKEGTNLKDAALALGFLSSEEFCRPEAISTSLASPETLERTAERMEAELGEERWQYIDGCQRDWDALPPPGPPLTIGLDGGFIHAS